MEITGDKEYKRQVLIRIVSIIKCLAKNLTLMEGNENVFEENSGIYFNLIKMLAEFDPAMQEYLRHTESNQIECLVNELIQMLANEVKIVILEKIKKAKYFSLILCCSPDVCYEKQVPIIIRCVNTTVDPVKVEEFFLGFSKVDGTVGTGLISGLETVLSDLGLNIDDMRGYSYDDANVKGNSEGVRNRLLDGNPRAVCTPYGCYSLNIALCDMAYSSPKAISYFGCVQRLFSLFTSSTKWLDIFRRHVDDLSLEPLSQERWESHIECSKSIRYNALKIRDALLDLASSSTDAMTCSQAISLADEEFESFEFLVSTVIWYKVLLTVDNVSKALENEDIDIDAAIEQLKVIVDFLRDYRNHGFDDALTEAQELAREMDIGPIFLDMKQTNKRRRLDKLSIEEVGFSVKEHFRLEYFMYIVDKALTSFEERYKQFCLYNETFGFLFNLKNCIDDETLESSCKNLSNVLTHNGQVDIDGADLFLELQSVRHNLPSEVKSPIQVLNYLSRLGCYPYAVIAYRILLTIPVTVGSQEKRFSKLKLIKDYLQITMSQEQLNGLDILSIERNVLDEVDHFTLIDGFASKNARTSIFK